MRPFAIQAKTMGPVCPAQCARVWAPRLAAPSIRPRIAHGSSALARPHGPLCTAQEGGVDAGGHAP